MAWDQGPYPATDGCVRQIDPADAATTIRDRGIDCVYSLFQIYRPELWGPEAPGITLDVWTQLRTLLLERERGTFDAPIVRHWGFDIHDIDLGVARALDGHIICNREKLAYWEAPAHEGGCALDAWRDRSDISFLDGDRPKIEFMNDRFSTPLSDADHDPHTVCIGRPFNIDYIAAARCGIHVHIYGNNFNDVTRWIEEDAIQAGAQGTELLDRYLHVHTSLQTIGKTWDEVRRIKGRWVEEFSRYDAGWSYIGNPLGWAPLNDRAAIPNRLGTYLLAGLPVITDRRPGSYRYDEMRRLGVVIELVDSDYSDLRSGLDEEVRTRRKRAAALAQRKDFSFEATIPSLVGALERARQSYHSAGHAERTRFDEKPGGWSHPASSPRARGPAANGLAPRILGWARRRSARAKPR
jgi:hypothetical protein